MIYLARLIRFLFVSLKFVRHPESLDDALSVAGSLNTKREVRTWIEYYRKFPQTARALTVKPELGHIDVRELAQLPAGTLGQSFAEFLYAHGFKADDIKGKNAHEIAGTEEEYVVNYFYETHDLYHVVTGFATDLAGEMGLQAFYATKGPSVFPIYAIVLGLLNTFLFARETKDARLGAVAAGWRMGRESSHLFGIDWKTLWPKPLAEVRRELRIPEEGFAA